MAGIEETRLAYARQALANADYDLAKTAIKPIINRNTDAAALFSRVRREYSQMLSRRRRNRILTAVAILFILALIGSGALLYYRNRGKIDEIASAAATYDRSMRERDERYIIANIETQVRAATTAFAVIQSTKTLPHNEVQPILDLFVPLGEEFRTPNRNDLNKIHAICQAVKNKTSEIQSIRDMLQKKNESLSDKPEFQHNRQLLEDAIKQLDKLLDFLSAYT